MTKLQIDDLLIAVFHGIGWFSEEEEGAIRKALAEVNPSGRLPDSINMKHKDELKLYPGPNGEGEATQEPAAEAAAAGTTE